MHALNLAIAAEETGSPDSFETNEELHSGIAEAPKEDIGKLKDAMNQIGSSIGELSVNIADTSGVVGDVSQALDKHAAAFHALTGDIDQSHRPGWPWPAARLALGHAKHLTKPHGTKWFLANAQIDSPATKVRQQP